MYFSSVLSNLEYSQTLLGAIQIICDTFLAYFRPPLSPMCHLVTLALILPRHDCVLSNKRTKPGNEAQFTYRREPHLENQATERLFKDAPLSVPTLIFIVKFELSTSQ